MGKVPLQIVKEFEHQARQNLPSIFQLSFPGSCPNAPWPWKNCKDSIKANVKQIRTQIQKGANPEKAARNGYEKPVTIYLSWIRWFLFNREPYPVKIRPYPHSPERNVSYGQLWVLIRPEVEVTHRNWRHEPRNSPFCPPLFLFSIGQGGRSFPLRKAPLRTVRVLNSVKTSLFLIPATTRKEEPTGNASMGVNPLQSFSSGRGK